MSSIEALVKLKSNLSRHVNRLTTDDYCVAFDALTTHMREHGVATIRDNQAFFKQLFDEFHLSTVLNRGVRVDQLTTREHALLFVYDVFRTNESSGAARESLSAVDEKTTAVANDALEAIGIGFINHLLGEKNATDGQNLQQTIQKAQTTFNSARFFHYGYANFVRPQRTVADAPLRKCLTRVVSPAVAEQYRHLWLCIKKAETAAGVVDVGIEQIARSLYETQTFALLSTNREKTVSDDDDSDLFLTIYCFWQRALFFKELRDNVLRQTKTDLTTLRRGRTIDNLIQNTIEYFRNLMAYYKLCELEDARTGRLGDASTRLRLHYATELPTAISTDVIETLEQLQLSKVEYKFDLSTKTFSLRLLTKKPSSQQRSATTTTSSGIDRSSTLLLQYLLLDNVSYSHLNSMIRLVYYSAQRQGNSLSACLESLVNRTVTDLEAMVNLLTVDLVNPLLEPQWRLTSLISLFINNGHSTAAKSRIGDRSRTVNNETRRASTINNETRRASTINNETQRASTINNETQRASTINNETRRASTINNETQRASTIKRKSDAQMNHDDSDDNVDDNNDDDDDDGDINVKKKQRKSTDAANVYDTFDYDLPRYFPPMLYDEERNRRFHDAISSVISEFRRVWHRAPRVLDVGAGSGLLSIFAARAGAAMVVGVEASANRAALARQNIEAHKLTDTCTIIECLSTDFHLRTCDAREPFDILICELLGTTAHYERQNTFVVDLFERNVVRSFCDDVGSHRRAPTTRYVVPQHIEMWIQPYRRRHSSADIDAGANIVDRSIPSLAANNKFQMHGKFGIVPHIRHFTLFDRRVTLINQASWTPLALKENIQLHLPLADGANVLFVEWRCRLWADVYLTHTLPTVSGLTNDNYVARLMSWGFAVCVPNSNTESLTLALTIDDIVVKRVAIKKNKCKNINLFIYLFKNNNNN